MYQQRRSLFGNIPPVVKNLLIINTLVFFATYILQHGIQIPGVGFTRINLNSYLGLYTPGSPKFHFYQYLTYMFMHGSIDHIFLNMFALFMFGRILEQVWGSQKFLFYYMVTGIGAGLLFVLIAFIRVKLISPELPPQLLSDIYEKSLDTIRFPEIYYNDVNSIVGLLYSPLIGASGAIFGLLLAFGMLFPEEKIYIYFLLPLKAKWFVMIYGGFELFSMIQAQHGDNVAHLAHLGGMLFGFILLRYWRKKQF